MKVLLECRAWLSISTALFFVIYAQNRVITDNEHPYYHLTLSVKSEGQRG